MEIRRTDKPWTEVEADWLIIPVIESGTVTGQLEQTRSGVGRNHLPIERNE